MEKRLVRSEMVMVRRLAAFLSDLLHWSDDMQSRLDLVDGGKDTFNRILKDTTDLFNDVIKTVPNAQRASILNSMSDFKVTLQPVLTPESQSVLMTKKDARSLYDMAQERCKGCVNGTKEAEKCPVYHLMLANVPLENYGNDLICPYSIAEWEE